MVPPQYGGFACNQRGYCWFEIRHTISNRFMDPDALGEARIMLLNPPFFSLGSGEILMTSISQFVVDTFNALISIISTGAIPVIVTGAIFVTAIRFFVTKQEFDQIARAVGKMSQSRFSQSWPWSERVKDFELERMIENVEETTWFDDASLLDLILRGAGIALPMSLLILSIFAGALVLAGIPQVFRSRGLLSILAGVLAAKPAADFTVSILTWRQSTGRLIEEFRIGAEVEKDDPAEDGEGAVEEGKYDDRSKLPETIQDS